MAKPRRLTALKINEVSSVDNGAGRGVRVALIKNNTTEEIELSKNETAAIEAEEYFKREFTTERRRALARTNQAMADGSYPIVNTDDLKNAIRAIGRAKSPGKTKKHIIRRARALGATDRLPDAWVRKNIEKYFDDMIEFFNKSEGGEDFATELSELKNVNFGEGLQNAIHDAGHAMKHSIESILDEPTVSDKGGAIRQSFGQFLDHLQTLCPEGDVAKISKRASEILKLGSNTSSPEAYQVKSGPIDVSPSENPPTKPATSVGSGTDPKQPKAGGGVIEEVEEGEDPAMKKALKKAKVWKKRYEALLELGKKDKESKDYMDHEDNDMDAEDCAKFLKMTIDERAEFRKAHPIGTLTEKRVAALPEPVRKAMEAGQAAMAELTKRQDQEMLQAMAKRATDLAIPSAHAPTLAPHFVTLQKANPEAFEEVSKAFATVVKALVNQRDTSVIYKEFGTARGADIIAGTPYEQLMAKATAYREEMSKIGKNVTEAQAFEKVYSDPTNVDLVALEKRQRASAG